MNSETSTSLRILTFQCILFLLDELGASLCSKRFLQTLAFAAKAFMHFLVRGEPVALRFLHVVLDLLYVYVDVTLYF